MTPRQVAFVREYLASGNATQAMIAAGYSERSASNHASRLLAHPEIRKLVERGREAQASALAIAATEELEVIAAEANSEIRDARAQISSLRRRLRTATAAIHDLERLVAMPEGNAGPRAPASEPATECADEIDEGDPELTYRPILPRANPAAARPWPAVQGFARADYDPFD